MDDEAERIAKFAADVERYTRQREAAKAARIWDDARFWQSKISDATNAIRRIERQQRRELAAPVDDFPCCSGGEHV